MAAMTLPELRALMESGSFHHATYRDHGTLWEGLYIYERATNEAGGFRGYKLAGAFHKNSSDLAAAERIVAPTGVSVGAYGEG